MCVWYIVYTLQYTVILFFIKCIICINFYLDMKLILKNSIKKSEYYIINSLFFTNKNNLEINYFY